MVGVQSLPGWMPILLLLGGLLGAGGVGALIKTVLDHRRGVRKQTDDVALGLVEKLSARVTDIEKSSEARIKGVEKAAEERIKEVERSAASQVRRVEAISAIDHEICDLRLAAIRHRQANMAGAFNGMLMMYRAAPERIEQFVAQIEVQRQQQEAAEAAESASANAAIAQLTADKARYLAVHE